MAYSLLRAVVLKFGGDDSAGVGLDAEWGDVKVSASRSVSVDGKAAGVLCVASAPVHELVISDGKVALPEEARRNAERAIETVARLIALKDQLSHSLSSPMPYVGLTSDDAAEFAGLQGLRVESPVVAAHPLARMVVDDIDPQDFLDRLDGLALLTEALNATSPLGRYMQLMRLFERGFKLGPGAVTGPLSLFLQGSAYGFSSVEVEAWTAARAQAAHADRREEFYLDADVRPLIERMLQGGYDVLLNKKTWREKSISRRDVWSPASGTRGSGSDIFITRGQPAKLAIQAVDGFAAYPLMLAGPTDDLLPLGAWLKGDVDGGELTLLGTAPSDRDE